jgi:hypothetical protein
LPACEVRSHADLRLRNHEYQLDELTPRMRQMHDDAVARGCGCEKQRYARIKRKETEDS